VRLIGVKLPEYGHYWEGNPAAFLSINLVETEQFEGFYRGSGHDGVEQHHGLQQDVILLLQFKHKQPKVCQEDVPQEKS
jgi:hypothetical protein